MDFFYWNLIIDVVFPLIIAIIVFAIFSFLLQKVLLIIENIEIQQVGTPAGPIDFEGIDEDFSDFDLQGGSLGADNQDNSMQTELA